VSNVIKVKRFSSDKTEEQNNQNKMAVETPHRESIENNKIEGENEGSHEGNMIKKEESDRKENTNALLTNENDNNRDSPPKTMEEKIEQENTSLINILQ